MKLIRTKGYFVGSPQATTKKLNNIQDQSQEQEEKPEEYNTITKRLKKKEEKETKTREERS